MKIVVLCTDPNHAVVPRLKAWKGEMADAGHDVRLVSDRSDVGEGEFLFLVSCSQLIGADIRARFRFVLVLHASDLPKGRGWSPYVWDIVEGSPAFTLCLLEAEDKVDSGRIWYKETIPLEGHELLGEINFLLFEAECTLMTRAVDDYASVEPTEQTGEPGPHRPRRSPADSRIDPERSLAEQFDLLRVVDNERYPAFFDYRGHRYTLKIEKGS